MAAKGIFLGFLAAGASLHQVRAVEHPVPLNMPRASSSVWQETATAMSGQPELAAATPVRDVSPERRKMPFEAQRLADWVIESGDNGEMPFVIVDKKNATVLIFDAGGQMRGVSQALLGLALGDDIVPGIGRRKLSTIRASERITPSGRFIAALGHTSGGQEVLWIDYEAGIALHRVDTRSAKERRGQRLASPTTLDNRISYGCINVSVEFYENVISPMFRGTSGVAYVLPETSTGEKGFVQYRH